MKTRILTLLMMLFAFAWSAKADEITSLKLTISHNGGEFREVSFPAEGWPDLDLTDESTTSIRIKRVEVQTSGTVSNVVFEATMYKTEEGLQPDDDWRTFDLPRQGNTWVLDFGENAPDIIDDEMGSSPRTFQFHVTAKDGSGNDIFFNNGGLDYKVLFVKGGGSSSSGDIKNFTITMSRNGGDFYNETFSAEGHPDIDFSEDPTTSLVIKQIVVQADETVSNVVFSATMFKTENGLRPDDGWRTFDLDNRGGGKWVLRLGDGIDLIDEEMGNSPRTFQFYVKGQDGSGNDIYCNNNGEDYKILFSKGGASLPIKNLILTIRYNGGEAFNQEIPAEDFPVVDLTDEQTTSLIIEKIEVQAVESVSEVVFCGTMYSTNGGPSGDEWREFNMEYKSNGRWMLYFGEGVELVEEDWIGKNKTKTFEFYVKAKDYFGNDTFYNNGGEDYKVTFTTGESTDWKIKFLDGITAGLTFSLDGEDRVYNFNGAGDRVPEDQLGQLSSLCIDQFALLFYKAEGVKTNDVSLQYRVYEEGQEPEGGWSRINATHLDQEEGNQMFCYTDIVGINVTNGLEPNKDYVLEVNYQVVVDGEYIFLGKNKEGSKFRFSIGDGGSQTEGIRSFVLTINCDGEVFTEEFPASGWPIHDIPGLTSSIKIMKAEVMSSESVTYVGLCSTMYDTEDGWQHDDTAWDWVPLENRGGGYWVLDFGQGKELIESDWLTQTKMKTFEFFADGGDANGNVYQYANGVGDYGYNNNYKVRFTTGPDDDAISLIPASQNTNGAIYNLAGQRVNDGFKGIVISNGKKILK